MKITNRRARHDYQLADKFETGLVLTGAEVKSVLEGKIHLEEAYAKIIQGELFLINAHIHPYRFAETKNIDSRRTRKLLVHKKELVSLASKIQQKNLTLIPVSCYTKGRKIKLKLALAKAKKKYEKREAKKRKEVDREIERALREKE
jgi:SsrA-binding protein